MGRFILKRVLLMIPILFGVTIIVFTVMSFTPGDPARLMLGQAAPKEAVEQLREEMGLNDPFVVRYVRYILAPHTAPGALFLRRFSSDFP